MGRSYKLYKFVNHLFMSIQLDSGQHCSRDSLIGIQNNGVTTFSSETVKLHWLRLPKGKTELTELLRMVLVTEEVPSN